MTAMSDAQDTCSGSSPPAHRRRRRWYQFGLRSLFLFTTAVVGLLVAWRTYVEPYRQQRDTVEVITRLGGTFEASEALTWQRWVIGGNLQNITRVDLSNCDAVYQFFPHVAELPRLE